MGRSERDRLLRASLRERFLITCVDGEAFAGLLVDVDTATVVLVDAAYHPPKGAPVAVDGQLFLPRTRIAYMQRAAYVAAPS